MKPFALFAAAVALVIALPSAKAADASCPESDAGITLSPGFCATVFADKVGHVRHMTVTPDNVLYANSRPDRKSVV